MVGLYDSIKLLLATLMVILDQINKIAFFEIATDPIFFHAVFKDAAALEHVALELADVGVAVLEEFLAETV